MATDRSYWKALDQAKYGSQVAFANVQTAMQDVHRRTYRIDLWDHGVPADGFGLHAVVHAQRAFKVTGLSINTTTTVTANDVNFAVFALLVFRNGALISVPSVVTTQTLAFAGGPPWGTGTLTGNAPFDVIAFQNANPSKLGIFSQQFNIIEKGDVLMAFINKVAAGVAVGLDDTGVVKFNNPANMTIDIEEV